MSELTNTRHVTAKIRWQLLATASAGAILAACGTPSEVLAEQDTSTRPTVWIELGGQLEQQTGLSQVLTPDFVSGLPDLGFKSPIKIEQPLRYTNGAEAKLTFEPGSDGWVFSAGVRYGRSNTNNHVHDQQAFKSLRHAHEHYATTNHGSYLVSFHAPARVAAFVDTTSKTSESHLIVDFQAGKDVGLGMFGEQSNSSISLGVRFAQLQTKSNDQIRARPDVQFSNLFGGPLPYYPAAHFNTNYANGKAVRSFSGVGPSIAWNASATLVGQSSDSSIAVNWGVNAALLFGRQKAVVSHHTNAQYYGYKHYPHFSTLYDTGGGHSASHEVVTPNVGGFASISFRYAAASVNLGYRADFFFGAIDGGLDKRQSETVGFYGPFASVSIGLGG